MPYNLVQTSLSPAQSKRILQGMEAKKPVSVTLSPEHMIKGEYPLMLTDAQAKKLKGAKQMGSGCGLRLSPKQMRESFAVSEQIGSGFFKDAFKWIKKNIVPLGKKAVKVAMPAIKKGLDTKFPGTADALTSVGLGHGCIQCPTCQGSGIFQLGVPAGQGNARFLQAQGLGLGEDRAEALDLF